MENICTNIKKREVFRSYWHAFSQFFSSHFLWRKELELMSYKFSARTRQHVHHWLRFSAISPSVICHRFSPPSGLKPGSWDEPTGTRAHDSFSISQHQVMDTPLCCFFQPHLGGTNKTCCRRRWVGIRKAPYLVFTHLVSPPDMRNVSQVTVFENREARKTFRP